jgi:hypothetical protein
MTMGPKQKTFLVLRPFEGALKFSILIAGTQVMLRKSYFFRRGFWLRPKSRTPRPRIRYTIETHTPTDLCAKFQLSRCYTGREIGHRRMDRRTDDITISVEPIFLKMCSKKCALKIMANFHVLRLFIPKKSDAQVGRVNTFHILLTIRKGPLNFKICMKRPSRFSNF